MSDKAHRERTLLYTVAFGVVRVIAAVVFPMRFYNRERVDALNAPYMIIGNHKTFMDPIAMALGVRYDEIHFVGKKELGKCKLIGKLFEKLHAIMIGRGETDMAAMRKCMQTLKDGHVLGIFPEGTRHQEEMMQHVESGAALIALRGRVPVIPMYIHGKIRPFRINRVYFGEVMETEDLLSEGINSESVKKLCDRIRDTFYQMRDAVNGAK